MVKQPFRIKARTLVHLGAELITTDAIALNELIKNAFDAHSKEVRIDFDIPFDPQLGYRLAKDISKGEKTPQQAVEELQKNLADELEAVTAKSIKANLGKLPSDPKLFPAALEAFVNETCTIRVEDWGDGMSSKELLDVFLVIGTPVKQLQKKKGADTAILGDKGIGRLSMMRLGRFATVVSAKKETDKYHQIEFDWVGFDDPENYLDEINLEVMPAEPKNTLNESGTLIEITGLRSSWVEEDIKEFITYLRRLQDPFNTNHHRFPIKVYRNKQSQPIARMNRRLVESAQFEARFEVTPSYDRDSIMLSRQLRWKGQTTFEKRDWPVETLCNTLGVMPQDFISLGPLKVGCYWYNRRKLSHPTGEWDLRKIRDELNIWAGGFALYRDGFRIGLTGAEEGDWLRMSATALRGTGYRLNNIQTIGSIAISYAENPALIDTANREDLVDCPEYQLLAKLIKVVIVDDLRSTIHTYTDAESKNTLAEHASEESVKRAANDINSTLKQVNQLVQNVPKEIKPNVVSIRDNLKQHVDYIQTIQKSVELAQEKKIEILELAGIGMSVEIIAHELARVTIRTADLLGQLGEVSDEKELEKLIDSIESQLTSVNKRIKAIDPLSPSGRNRKEKFDLVAFIRSIFDGYAPRFKRHHVTASLTVDGEPPKHEIKVRLVRGFIAHIIENLLSNSMYWLVQAPQSPSSGRKIGIDMDRYGRFIELYDTGPGIDPSHIHDVFKPYFSYRKNGKGLGLYIARELAEYHGGKLYLSQDAQGDGRLRHFIIEFPKD